MRRALVCLLAAISVPAGALDAPRPSSYDPRIQQVVYNPDDVVRLETVVGVATQVAFAPGERVLDLACGFAQGWEITPRENQLYLKAVAVKAAGSRGVAVDPAPGVWDTNLIVRTDRRSYAFDLRLLAPVATPAFRVAFRYPGDDAAQAHRNATQAELTSRLQDRTAPVNWQYTMQAGRQSNNILPSMAYDDGRFTYLQFPGNDDFPVAYLVGPDDAESLVNTHIDPRRPDVLVIHRVAARLVLRLGDAVVGLYNEAYDPRGLPPTDGTTIPGVRRLLRDSPPADAPPPTIVAPIPASAAPASPPAAPVPSPVHANAPARVVPSATNPEEPTWP